MCASENKPDDGDERWLDVARRNGRDRLIRCLFAEGYLVRTQLDGDALSLSGGATLRFADLWAGPGATMLNLGAVDLLMPDGRATAIDTPDALMAAIAPDLSVTAQDIARLLADMEDSARNDALARHHRHDWARTLRTEIAAHGAAGLLDHLHRHHGPRGAAIFLDQWGALEGHPFYPTWKAKPGLSPTEVAALSPEFGTVTELVIAALRKDRACLEWMPGIAPEGVLVAAIPGGLDDWAARLTARGLAPADYWPMPVHGWHLAHFVMDHFAQDIADGALIPEGPMIHVRPTMSFRTMLPCTPDGIPVPGAPFIKLPVAIWMTSERRSLQAKSVHMGPRLSHIIARILRDENGFSERLEIFTEPLGVIRAAQGADGNAPPCDTRATGRGRGDTRDGRFLSVVYRDATPLDREDGLIPVPVAALLTAGPDGIRPLFGELIDAAGGDAEQVFATYCRTVLEPVIAMYMLYGVAFEAHQQNTLILFDGTGQARRMVIRDFGDGRTFAPMLAARGHQIAPFVQAGILPTTFDADISLVRSFVIDASLVCHLHEVALCLARMGALAGKDAWHIIAAALSTAFDTIHDRVDPAFWTRERQAFLEADWPTRSVLRMHLEGYADYRREHLMPNPLRELP